MKKLFILAFTLGSLVACSGDTSGDATGEAKVATTKEVKKVEADYEVTMEISGMSCVAGCGKEIETALIESGGVESVSYDFESGRQPNIAKVKFDSKLTSGEKLEEIIHGILDEETKERRFSVLSFSESPLNPEPASTGGGERNADEISIRPNESSSFIELPNILDIFTSWFSF